MNQPELQIVGGNVYTTSLDVAKVFERKHKDVMNSIRSVLKYISDAFNGRNFSPILGKDSYGREVEMYRLTKNGFAMIALGFTGEKAIKFREAYITRFDEMENQLREMQAKENRSQFKQRTNDQLLLFPKLKETFLSERPSISVSSAYDVMILKGLHIPPISRNQLISLIKTGKLEGFKAERKWHIYQDSFSHWLKLRKQSS